MHMPKILLFAIALIVILLTASATLFFDDSFKKDAPDKSEIDTAVNQAKFLYRQVRSQGWDFSEGPCLSNALMPDWVVDIAHNPRTLSDDLPQNQCPAFIEKRAGHFVELDPEGNLIRAR